MTNDYVFCRSRVIFEFCMDSNAQLRNKRALVKNKTKNKINNIINDSKIMIFDHIHMANIILNPSKILTVYSGIPISAHIHETNQKKHIIYIYIIIILG
jgi:hypothetical protein